VCYNVTKKSGAKESSVVFDRIDKVKALGMH